jgi:putative DNA primase/helicase
MIPHRQNGAPTPLPAWTELQARPQWVCWRVEERSGKPTKVPYNPRTGQRAASNDPTTWASYELARQACEQQPARYAGVGFVFAGDYTGVDLDHCVQSDGQIDSWARMVLERLASYAEYSPNDGIHVLLRGTIPAGVRRRLAYARHPEAALEMYCAGRYFTMTGQHVPGTPATIRDGTDEVQMIVADLALVEQAAGAANGAKFRALWQGDTTAYLSPSEADQALCTLLAFWADGDPARVDRLFRASGLYRPDKWDRAARAGETYGQGTVARACQLVNQAAPGPGAGDPGGSGVILPFPTRGRKPTDPQDRSALLADLPAVDLAFVLDCLSREEEGDARLYAHLFRGRCIYDHTEGFWYEWHGHAWQRDEQKHALVLASGPLAAVYLEASAALAEQAAQQARRLDSPLAEADNEQQKAQYARLKKETAALIERARRLKTLKRAQNVLTYAQALLPLPPRVWDRNPWLLACPNGVLDVRTGELAPGRPEDYIRTVIPTAWEGLDAPAPRWEQFLQEVFADRDETTRAELIAFLQRLLGYGITGDVSEQVFLVLYGEEGRNGKDTIQRAISHTLGNLSSAISKDVLLEAGRLRSAGSATPHICDLQGKRLAWASEPEKGARFSISQVKEYSGGGEIPSRGMYEREIRKIKPTHLLILLTNHKPYADSEDKAFWDRLRLVTFNLRFVDHPQAPNERKKDTRLWQALEAEASGILAWLVRGCLEWQRRGLATPTAVLSDGEQYRREQDALDLFLSACCELDEQANVKASTLYEAYVRWSKANNLRGLMTGTSFGKKIARRFEKRHTERGAAYRGIRLLDLEETPTLFNQESAGAILTGLTIPDGLDSKPVSHPQAALQANGDTPLPPVADGLTGLYRKSPISKKWGSIGDFLSEPVNPSGCPKSPPLKQPVERNEQPDGFADQPVRTRQDPSAIPQAEGAREFPFPPEWHYVLTPTGTVGSLSQNERGASRHVRSVLDGRESEWLASALRPLTFEEARAWWREQTTGTPEQHDEAGPSP